MIINIVFVAAINSNLHDDIDGLTNELYKATSVAPPSSNETTSTVTAPTEAPTTEDPGPQKSVRSKRSIYRIHSWTLNFNWKWINASIILKDFWLKLL